MGLLTKFTKLMKSAPPGAKNGNGRRAWVIDEGKYLSLDEVARLRATGEKLRAAGLGERRFSNIRDWFLVELGFATGLRVAEMTSLRHGDVHLDGDRSSIVVVGKGQKKRSVWIGSEFKLACRRYLGFKQGFGFSVDGEDYVVNNARGTRINKRSLQKAFKMLLREAQLPLHYHIHCLRHTYTTFLLQASNHNYRFAQQQLGHSSIRTTQVYAGVLESEGRKALEKMYR